jgi:hypothetical protein
MIAINVPKMVNYYTVYLYLDTGKAEGRWNFELSHKAHIMGMPIDKTVSGMDSHISILLERIGGNLRRSRDNKRYSIQTVSKNTGISDFVIFETENGNGAELELGPFLKLCTYYGNNPADTLK